MISRKGQSGETMLIPAVLFVMVIIAVGMIVGVSLVLGNSYEFRKVDAKALNYNIRECIFENSVDEIREDIIKTCNFNKHAIESSGMFFKICENISAEECSSSNLKISSFGNNFEACFFIAAQDNDNYPKCIISEFVFSGKKYSVISGSNQNLRRIKL